MRFQDAEEEQDFLQMQWQGDKNIIRLFALTVVAHSGYLLIPYYVGFTGTRALSSILLLWGIYIPLPILIVISAFGDPFKRGRRKVRALWYFSITVLSIMVAFGVLLRTIFCYYGVDPPDSCSVESRPVSSANYSIIYLLLGPFLILNVMNNRRSYELPAIVLVIAMTVWVIIITPNKNFLTYFGLLFIVGAQAMALLVSRSREKTQRSRFVSDTRNVKLSEDLRQEVQQKTAAQIKAQDEENKRTQFTNMLFHEMRVPLNTVILSMNDIESDDTFRHTLSKDMLDNFDRIDHGLNAIITVLNDSLDFRKMSEGKLQITEEPFDYKEMITEVVHSMESNWRAKNITFQLDYDPRLEEIPNKLLGDRNRLRQVVANYLSNAVKFTPQNGKVTLQTLLEELEGGAAVVYTHVQDTGIGIKKEDQGKLFKPFVQLNPEKTQGGKGSGLGLSICASIIKSMGGQYGLISDYGKGSIFWYRVRLKLSQEPLKGKPLSIVTSAPLAPLSILVTDDDQATRRIMRRILERLNNTVDEASDGIECLEKVAEKGEFDVIFIDNLMPRLNGMETIRLLRSKNYKGYIVSVTGSGDATVTKELLLAGANRIMLKPASKELIQEVLSEVPTEAKPP